VSALISFSTPSLCSGGRQGSLTLHATRLKRVRLTDRRGRSSNRATDVMSPDGGDHRGSGDETFTGVGGTVVTVSGRTCMARNRWLSRAPGSNQPLMQRGPATDKSGSGAASMKSIDGNGRRPTEAAYRECFSL
jgi:hypothetical protein